MNIPLVSTFMGLFSKRTPARPLKSSYAAASWPARPQETFVPTTGHLSQRDRQILANNAHAVISLLQPVTKFHDVRRIIDAFESVRQGRQETDNHTLLNSDYVLQRLLISDRTNASEQNTIEQARVFLNQRVYPQIMQQQGAALARPDLEAAA